MNEDYLDSRVIERQLRPLEEKLDKLKNQEESRINALKSLSSTDTTISKTNEVIEKIDNKIKELSDKQKEQISYYENEIIRAKEKYEEYKKSCESHIDTIKNQNNIDGLEKKKDCITKKELDIDNDKTLCKIRSDIKILKEQIKKLKEIFDKARELDEIRDQEITEQQNKEYDRQAKKNREDEIERVRKKKQEEQNDIDRLRKENEQYVKNTTVSSCLKDKDQEKEQKQKELLRQRGIFYNTLEHNNLDHIFYKLTKKEKDDLLDIFYKEGSDNIIKKLEILKSRIESIIEFDNKYIEDEDYFTPAIWIIYNTLSWKVREQVILLKNKKEQIKLIKSYSK